ncbi:hypothetical protein LNKW23_42580 [Paralimibaculum aggregatum]|uniref:Uncharacterized protein n=1 Tax=Paralimibaculum aggregatum TaxID=3036245 RepID=A0ABQ6LSI9_9RHOB|nr:hypothetical protein LNKW23_42580 [Limibaculum sp. NKW23]
MEAAEHAGAAGADEPRQRDAGHAPGQRLRRHRGRRERPHGAGEHRRGDRDALARAGMDPERRRHRLAMDQRRIDVDAGLQHRPRPGAVHQPRHRDAAGGPLRRRDAARAGLGRERQMRRDHVEMVLVDRWGHRLADGAAGVVRTGRGLGHAPEVAETLDGGMAPAALETGYEGRAMVRHKRQMIAAEHDVAGRLAPVQHDLRRRAGTERAHGPA